MLSEISHATIPTSHLLCLNRGTRKSGRNRTSFFRPPRLFRTHPSLHFTPFTVPIRLVLDNSINPQTVKPRRLSSTAIGLSPTTFQGSFTVFKTFRKYSTTSSGFSKVFLNFGSSGRTSLGPMITVSSSEPSFSAPSSDEWVGLGCWRG